MSVVDLNNKKARKLIDDLNALSAQLLISTDSFEKVQTHNTIQEKLEFLYDSLIRIRN